MQRPLLRFIIAQTTALVVVLGPAILISRHFAYPLPPALLLLAQGVVAATLGQLLKLPRWWLPINLALPLACWQLWLLQLPSWVYLLGFLLLLLVNWNSHREGVPLYLSNRKTWQALAGYLQEQPPSHFVDLGSGTGGTLFYLARCFPQCQFVGVESAPLPYAISKFREKLHPGKNVRITYGSFWETSLAPYDVVYCFLSPLPMKALYQKARSEMGAGARLISNSFTVTGVQSDLTLEVDDRRATKLHLWRM